MPIAKRKTWFLVADGTKARVFESEGPKTSWECVEEWRDDDARAPARELGADRPVRGRKIGSGQNYAIETPSEHDKAEAAFIRQCADFINASARKGAFDQLALAAPPRALGEFRKRLSADAAGKYISVLDKDLTNLSDHDLLKYYRTHIERW